MDNCKQLSFVKLDRDAMVPTKAEPGSNGYDLYALHDAVLPIGKQMIISTGIAIAIPEGHAGFICSRSGLAAKYAIFVLNAPGVIDESYRGELKVILYNAGQSAYQVYTTDRVAQIIFIKTENFDFVEVDKLSESTRKGGCGSTGR